jgi:predicted ATP-grasp superfamily ATP-dependent carboligase
VTEKHPSGRPPIVVSDGETRSCLAVTRSLGAAGYEVHVLSPGKRCLAGVSRYATRVHSFPSPDHEPAAWSSAVDALMARLRDPLFIPATEVSAEVAIESGLSERWRVALPKPESYRAAVDKHALMVRARALGIDVPKSTLVENAAEVERLPDGYRYPAILKARRSRWLDEGHWRAGGVRVVHDAAQLREAALAPDFAGGCLIQEFVPGHGEGLFFLVDHGRVVARFAHRRLREKPPTGGVSVLSESVDPDRTLLEMSERLLADLEWHGVVMVEYRRSPEGRSVLMEINPRLWGSVQLAIDAGVDFPRLMVALHTGEHVHAAQARTGVKLRWLLGDWDHLLIALRRREMRKAVGRSALGVIAAFLSSFFDGSRLEVLRRDDPFPFFHELGEWFRRLLQS